ncbi:MAG TPA: LytTR family DNA-binding domain-containing protein [Clostridia bacterium]|nr:LytTR family DNA-binding domain-containing protein [Clostridia bacterium]
MFRIAICDDNITDCNNIKNDIERICLKHIEDYCTHVYQNPKLLVSRLENGMDKYDVLLLDICMDEQNGMETAKDIRKTDEDLGIIFITSSPDYVYEGYDVDAAGYLLKPFDYCKLEKLLLRIWDKNNRLKHIKIENRGKIHNIAFKDILFLESNDKKIKVVTSNKEITTYGKLSDYHKILPGDHFIFCHKSFIVNLKHVKNMSCNSFTLASSITIPISRSRYKSAKNDFLRYLSL